MAAPVKAKGGKKQRKFGRWSRAPSMKAYKAVGRFSINKEKRRVKHLKAVAKKAARKAK